MRVKVLLSASTPRDKLSKLEMCKSELLTYLHVSLLYEADPKLLMVAGVGAQQLSTNTHWQPVIYHHLHKPTQTHDVQHTELQWSAGKEVCTVRNSVSQGKSSCHQNNTLYLTNECSNCYTLTLLLQPFKLKDTKYFP